MKSAPKAGWRVKRKNGPYLYIGDKHSQTRRVIKYSDEVKCTWGIEKDRFPIAQYEYTDGPSRAKTARTDNADDWSFAFTRSRYCAPPRVR